MLYIIESKDGKKAGVWDSLINQRWPDGGTFSGTVAVGAQRIHAGRSKDDPLNEIEIYTVKEVLPKEDGSGPRVVSTADPLKVGDEWHEISTMGEELPVEIDPVNYKVDRANELRQTIGDGSQDVLVGEQLDAVLKFFVSLRFEQGNIPKATTLDELKTILVRIADLPPEIDEIIGKWTAAKNKFNSPTGKATY